MFDKYDACTFPGQPCYGAITSHQDVNKQQQKQKDTVFIDGKV